MNCLRGELTPAETRKASLGAAVGWCLGTKIGVRLAHALTAHSKLAEGWDARAMFNRMEAK